MERLNKMLSPIRANDHFILKKISDQVLPLIIAGLHVKRQWFVRVATAYAYGGELATGLAGLGIGAPLVAFFQGKVENNKGLDLLREALPGAWFWIGVTALVFWLCLRVVVKQQNAIDSALIRARLQPDGREAQRPSWRTLLPKPNRCPR